MGIRIGIILTAMMAITTMSPLPLVADTSQPASPAAITPSVDRTLSSQSPGRPKIDWAPSVAVAALAALRIPPAPCGCVGGGSDHRAEPGAPLTQACPSPSERRLDLAAGSPLDCCKGHKGICGCRAGKIVCCDGSASADPNCTCHLDWGSEN